MNFNYKTFSLLVSEIESLTVLELADRTRHAVRKAKATPPGKAGVQNVEGQSRAAISIAISYAISADPTGAPFEPFVTSGTSTSDGMLFPRVEIIQYASGDEAVMLRAGILDAESCRQIFEYVHGSPVAAASCEQRPAG